MRRCRWANCLLAFYCFAALLLQIGAQRMEAQQTPEQATAASIPHAFDKGQFSLQDPSSLWVVVNKSHPLTAGYVPTDLVVPHVKLQLSPKSERMHVRQIVGGPLQDLFHAAQKDGYTLILLSGYRSEAYQKKIYDKYLRKLKTRASIASAQPGYSEHQTGLAVDVDRERDFKCLTMPCFAAMPEAKWLAAHAHEYGFIVRYEKNKEGITGYEYEPWHLRYVGKDLAAELFEKHETMEEFFGMANVPLNSAATAPVHP